MKVNRCIIAALMALGTTMFQACTTTGRPDQVTAPASYPLLLTGTSDSPKGSYIIPASNLMKDSAGNTKKAINIDHKLTNEQWIINRGNAFFYVDSQAGKFLKYEFKNGDLMSSGEIPFTLFTRANWSQWLKGDTLLIGGNDARNQKQHYAFIDTKAMALISSGVFSTPPPPDGMEVYSCTGILRSGKLYLGYSLIDPAGSGDGKYASDTAYLAAMDFPSMRNLKISKDTRSTFPGSGRAGNGDSFILNDDLYILSSPVDWNGQNRSKPTGFFRIKKGQDCFDPDYFFNLSAQLDDDDPDLLMYMGQGKAIVRSCQHRKVNQWSDWSKEITQYVFVDVLNQKVKVLDLPLFAVSSGGYTENGKAYLPVQTSAEGTRIYQYDMATGKVIKGIKIPGLTKFGKIYKMH